ncbi:MAG: S-adenosylmethionine:tRNA ribosyltransferase-isomerase, partial [Bacteroidota bacterium]
MPRPTHSIPIGVYDYALPEERIAQYPLPKRDDAKLLIAKPDTP